MAPTQAMRKRRGAWYTPADLGRIVIDGVLADFVPPPDRRPVRILDPACGDGRLLEELRVRLHLDGHSVEATGCDIDAGALAKIAHPHVRRIHDDALTREWGEERFDIVVGNPPFLSQMASSTTRGGSSRHGGGPYAGAAAEFLALAVRLAEPDGGIVGLVLPQSILAARDVGPIRDAVDELADHTWSWWEPEQRWFDANVNVCAMGFRRPATRPADPLAWTSIVTDRLSVPTLDLAAMVTDGELGDRAELNANFRDEYYALVPAVGDHDDGPRLVTSGLIDPGRCLWGERPVRFAKQRFVRPRVDLSELQGRFVDWAAGKLVPKILVANQTRVVEAWVDRTGDVLPGVPVTSVVPTATTGLDAIAAVLTSPVAAAWCWHRAAGTGLSATSMRIGPAALASVPWPGGDLEPAVAALAAGDVEGCGRLVLVAYGVAGPAGDELFSWWRERLPVR